MFQFYFNYNEHMGARKLIVVLLMLFAVPAWAESYCSEPTQNEQLQNDFSDYMKNINKKLQKNWTPPDFLEEAHTKVLFKINRHGIIYSASILESSGDKIYDESAIDAIKKSMPFEAFPQNTTRETLAVNYSFDTTLVKTDKMKRYYELAKRHFYNDRPTALKYINLAINEVNGDDESYFLYKRRAKIKEAMGDHVSAREDLKKYKAMKARVDIKRVNAIKQLAEIEDSAFAYYYLAYAYEQIEDYDNAIAAIDNAIIRTDLNNNYKRYKSKLMRKNNIELSNSNSPYMATK